MIPGYCYECMNRQMQMDGDFQQQNQMPYAMDPLDINDQQPSNLMNQQNIPLVQNIPLDQNFQLGQGTPVETDINYTQAYLRTKIGSKVKIEFLIGTSMLIDREGTLLDVGVSYVVIREVETDDDLLCDIYSIKFVRFYM